MSPAVPTDCRRCGLLVCGYCSSKKYAMANAPKDFQRACDPCYTVMCRLVSVIVASLGLCVNVCAWADLKPASKTQPNQLK